MGPITTKGSEGLQKEGLDIRDFQRLQAFAKEHWGFEMPDAKKSLVENRLLAFCRKEKIPSFQEVFKALFSGEEKDLEVRIFDTLSTNLTSFFRDPQHFALFEREVLQPFRRSKRGSSLKLWSAGCSAGCEPYSLAILCKEVLSPEQMRRVEILGTDYSVSALDQAKEGIFSTETTKEVDEGILRRHFLRGVGKAKGKVKIKSEITKLVQFRLLNLMEEWPGIGPFDSIFCRNVMIYFGAEAQASLIKRFTEALAPGGLLFFGSAESFARMATGLHPLGPSTFQKPGGNA